MNVYVLGAGVSAQVGYPLGGNLLAAVDAFIRKILNEKDLFLFDFSEWPGICARLEKNENSLIRCAYKFGHFEHLMTALDHNKIIMQEFFKDHGNRSGNDLDGFYEQANLSRRSRRIFSAEASRRPCHV